MSRSIVLDEAESKDLLETCGVPVPPFESRSRRSKRPPRRPKSWATRSSSRHWVWPTRPKVGASNSDLDTAAEVSAAVAEMSHLSDSYLIEKMVDGVVAELIVGVAVDEQFGPYLLIGGGGILVEMIKDSRSLLLPVNRERVLDALEALQCAPLVPRLPGEACGGPERCRRRHPGNRRACRK